MRVLFIHRNFPAQFGQLAGYLVEKQGYECYHVSERPDQTVGGVRCLQYRVKGGATRASHYCARTFENAVWHAHAVYETLERREIPEPDVIVGHSGFGSTLFLGDLFDCPIVNYFEYYYHSEDSDLDFRPDLPPTKLQRLRAIARNAMVLLDLAGCQAGYCPTRWQRSLFPRQYRDKLEVHFDGIDTEFWSRRPGVESVAGIRIPKKTRLVTYVSRALEPLRGFDIFVKLAERIAGARDDVLFVCAGDPTGEGYGVLPPGADRESYVDRLLEQAQIPRDRFLTPGRLAPDRLVELLSRSDLHVYLTVPFVASWSLLDAMSCGCVVLASDVAPVRELVTDGETGLLRDFFDLDGLVQAALDVLEDPAAYAPLAERARTAILERHSLDRCAAGIMGLLGRVTP